MILTFIIIIVLIVLILLAYAVGARHQYNRIFGNSINVVTETEKNNPNNITFIGIVYSLNSVCKKVIEKIDASDEVDLKSLRNDLNELYLDRNSSDNEESDYNKGYRNGQIKLLEKIFNLEDSVKNENKN